MPAKITQKEVVNQLYREYIVGCICNGDEEAIDTISQSVPITFKRFTLCMMSDDFITSTPTVKSKWSGLVASGVLAPTSKGDRAVIDTDAVCRILSIRKKTKTKTHTCANLSHGIEEESQ